MVSALLLDLSAELEASTALAFEAARAFDASLSDAAARPWLRVATALAKYRTAEEAVWSASRAIEIFGGVGYTEEFVAARLLRDAQVLTVWEGPANVQALELLRLMKAEQSGFEAFAQRIEPIINAAPPELDDLAAAVRLALDDTRRAVAEIRARPLEAPRHGRRLLDLMADGFSAALLLEEAIADLAGGDARKALLVRRFVAQRLLPQQYRGLAPADGAESQFDAIVSHELIPLAVLRQMREVCARPRASA
jgi:hypothetical protein